MWILSNIFAIFVTESKRLFNFYYCRLTETMPCADGRVMTIAIGVASKLHFTGEKMAFFMITWKAG